MKDGDRYRREREIGSGGAGRVWRVEDRRRAGQRLALKELTDASATGLDQLRREFAVLSQLVHPNLVEVHDLELEPPTGLPYFTMEFVEGLDLVSAVRRDGHRLVVPLAVEALRALAFLHDFDLLHRDLKPANLMVRERPRLGCRLVVLDFGLAMRGGRSERRQRGLAGTLPYLAPELFEGAKASPRSDLYSLGAVIFQAVHGRPPAEPGKGEFVDFVEAVRSGTRARPPMPPGVPAGLGRWLEDLLAPAPSHRPVSARDALARLNAAAGTRHPAETPVSRTARLASGPPPGRETEIRSLWNHLESSKGPYLVWITGAPGMGKGRLMRWLRGDALARGWGVVGFSADGTAPSEFLATVRDRAPKPRTLVLVEPFADGGDRVPEFLERVARDARMPPVRVVASLDPTATAHPIVSRLLAHSGKIPTVRRVDLGSLDTDGIRAVAMRSSGDQRVSGARLEWLREASEGNPTLAELLLTEEVWEKRGRGRHPVAAERSLELRLRRLSTDGVKWLHALSVLGIEAPRATMTDISGLDPASADEAASEVAAAGLAVRGTDGWRSSSRSRDLQVLDLLPEPRRTELFRRAAERLTLSSKPDIAGPRVLARLWSAAGDSRRACGHAIDAGEIAVRDGEPTVAAECFGCALAHVSRRDARRLDLRCKQAAALRDANLAPAAARAYGAAQRLEADPRRRAEIRSRQAEMLVQAGRFGRGLAVAEAALREAEAAGWTAVSGRARKVIGIAWARRGQGTTALPFLRKAVETFRELRDLGEQAHAVQALAVCEANDGHPDAREHFEKAIELYGEIGEPRRALISGVGLGALDQRAGRYDDSRRVLDHTRRVAGEHGNLLIECIVQYTLAKNAVQQDRLGEAIALAEEAEDQARYLADDRMICVSRTVRATALARCGRASEAVELLDLLPESSLDKVDPSLVGELRLARVEALIAGPNPTDPGIAATMARALRDARRWNEPDNRLWCLALEMERRARPPHGEPIEPIRAELDEVVARGGQWAQPYFVIRADLAKAASRIASHQFDAAIEIAETTTRRTERLDLPARGAEAFARMATALESTGRQSDAKQAIENARALLDAAASRIVDPAIRDGFRENIALTLPPIHVASPSLAGDRRLMALYDMIRALNSESDPDVLLERILDMAIAVVEAERGMILRHDPSSGTLVVRHARNLEQETIADVESYSRRIVEEASAGKSILSLDALHDSRFQDLKSVSLYRIRSLMCVPLRSRGDVVGAVYLDDRREGRLFSRDDLQFLEAFADHAALALQNARERARLVAENKRLQQAAEARVRYGNLVGRCPAMQEVFALIDKVASTELPVLIQGETGTGKELVARAIHFHGPRRKAPFVSENCAALPESLLESELFGHVRGAFTGAERDRQGMFEQANCGTLFLDEIGDMPLTMQAQLLRVLQDGELRRVGGDRPVTVDVRPITATHRDLEHRVEDGLFRQDLLYRLQVLMIELPPLRERPGDVPLLADHFLEQIARQSDHSRSRIDSRALARMEEYHWPGNVRQLQNTIHRLVVLAGDGPILEEHLASDPTLGPTVQHDVPGRVDRHSREVEERERIRKALAQVRNNRTRAARVLGISRATMYRKIKEYDL